MALIFGAISSRFPLPQAEAFGLSLAPTTIWNPSFTPSNTANAAAVAPRSSPRTSNAFHPLPPWPSISPTPTMSPLSVVRSTILPMPWPTSVRPTVLAPSPLALPTATPQLKPPRLRRVDRRASVRPFTKGVSQGRKNVGELYESANVAADAATYCPTATSELFAKLGPVGSSLMSPVFTFDQSAMEAQSAEPGQSERGQRQGLQLLRLATNCFCRNLGIGRFRALKEPMRMTFAADKTKGSKQSGN